MSTISHKNLTGTQLHETKGMAAATDDFVLTATSGAGVYKKLTAINLTGTGNSFGAQLYHLQEQRPNTNDGASVLSSSTFSRRAITTEVVTEISGTSLNGSSQFILPAGTYWVDISVVTTNTAGNAKLALYNVTDAAYTSILGLSQNSGGSATNFQLRMNGRLTIAGTKTLEIRQYCQTGGSDTGGRASSSGHTEVYLDAKIWKLS